MEDNTLIVKDDRGNELLEIIRVAEEKAVAAYVVCIQNNLYIKLYELAIFL